MSPAVPALIVTIRAGTVCAAVSVRRNARACRNCRLPGMGPMRSGLALLCAIAFAASAQPVPRWWIGFIDANDRAFLEIPADGGACAGRAALVRGATKQPGEVLPSRLSAAAQVGKDARLVFGVVDLAGQYRERVLPRVVALAREDEAARPPLAPPCWFLAEAGTEAPGYRAVEDRIVLAVHPPRSLGVKPFDQTWKSHAAASATDARLLATQDVPAAIVERVAMLLPLAAQVHAQPFTATLDPLRGPEPLWLIGAIEGGEAPAGLPGTFNTLNLIVRPGAATDAVLYAAGPSGGIGRDRAGSFAMQVAAALDLDGDGTDELLVRARYYSGGNLKVLRWNGRRFVEVHQSGYEGE